MYTHIHIILRFGRAIGTACEGFIQGMYVTQTIAVSRTRAQLDSAPSRLCIIVYLLLLVLCIYLFVFWP
jgi:hypothetical protein